MRNEGTLDRALRAVGGAALLALALFSGLGLFAQPVVFWGAVAIGAVLLVTAATGICPAYRLVGIKTCRDC